MIWVKIDIIFFEEKSGLMEETFGVTVISTFILVSKGILLLKTYQSQWMAGKEGCKGRLVREFLKLLSVATMT